MPMSLQTPKTTQGLGRVVDEGVLLTREDVHARLCGGDLDRVSPLDGAAGRGVHLQGTKRGEEAKAMTTAFLIVSNA